MVQVKNAASGYNKIFWSTNLSTSTKYWSSSCGLHCETCVERPLPWETACLDRPHIYVVNWVAFQDRFYCTLFGIFQDARVPSWPSGADRHQGQSKPGSHDTELWRGDVPVPGGRHQHSAGVQAGLQTLQTGQCSNSARGIILVWTYSETLEFRPVKLCGGVWCSSWTKITFLYTVKLA